MAKRKRLTLPVEMGPPDMGPGEMRPGETETNGMGHGGLAADSPLPLREGAGLETAVMFPAYPAGTPRRAPAPIASVASDAALAAALEEVTQTLHVARATGRMIQTLPLEAIQTDYLVRDRIPVADEAMEALTASLRQRGQQAPVEVVALAGGRYGLISGWRRVTALVALAAERGESGSVLAVLRRPAEASDAYLAMVEENEIRVGLSHYERARIAVKAVEQGVYPTQRAALQDLFRTASRAKRSKIGSFIPLVAALDDVLRFPTQIAERAGLALSKALEVPGVAAHLHAALLAARPATPEAEQAVIAAALRRPARQPAPEAACEVAPGLSLRRQPGGGLLLSGPAVDDGFHARLLAWLHMQG